MNNRERAERIWTDLSGRAGCGIDSWEPAIRSECLAMIAAQIEEAVREACEDQLVERISRMPMNEQIAYERGKAEGYAAAREQAARLLDERLQQNEIATELQALPDNKIAKKVRAWMWGVAERIRAMVPPGEGK